VHLVSLVVVENRRISPHRLVVSHSRRKALLNCALSVPVGPERERSGRASSGSLFRPDLDDVPDPRDLHPFEVRVARVGVVDAVGLGAHPVALGEHVIDVVTDQGARVGAAESAVSDTDVAFGREPQISSVAPTAPAAAGSDFEAARVGRGNSDATGNEAEDAPTIVVGCDQPDESVHCPSLDTPAPGSLVGWVLATADRPRGRAGSAYRVLPADQDARVRWTADSYILLHLPLLDGQTFSLQDRSA
jgi:hypothetical protein